LTSILSNKVILRSVEQADSYLVLQWENDPELWSVTENEGPFTLQQIETFIAENCDFETHGQTRWMIMDLTERTIGCIDLFDYDTASASTGIGILIADPKDRNNGFASDALRQIIEYLGQKNKLQRIQCLIHDDNENSIRLFQKVGFRKSGPSFIKGKNAHQYFYLYTRI
jgi:diamine N-acetyltransferase